MNDLRRGVLALAAAAAFLGMSTLGTAATHAAESPGAETPLERVNALVQPSIVYLQQDWSAYVYDKTNKLYLNEGQPFSMSFQCTGFVVNPDGYIATAGHCVDQDEVIPSFFATAAQWAVDNAYYENTLLTVDDILGFQSYRVETETKINRADLKIQVGWGASASGIETTQVKAARVIASQKSDAGDVALLKVEASDLNAIALSDQEVEVGTEVVSIGYPASVDAVTDPNLTPSYKDGSISSVKTVQGGLLTVYEISAAVSGGMSGGPTVNLDGEVVGVNSFGISGESQPFNFVRPSDQMAELLAGAGVTNEVSETTQAYRDGLAAYWDGDKETAVELLTGVVDEQPNNQLADKYLDKAKDLPDPPKAAKDSGGGFPIVPVVIGVVALLVVGGIVAFLMTRKKGGSSAGPAASGYPSGAAAPMASTPPTPPVAPMPPAPTPTAGPAPVESGPVTPSEAPTRPPTPVGFSSGPPPSSEAPPAAPPAAPPVQEPVVASPKFCPNCGSHSHPGQKFCEECGTPLHA